MSGTTSSWGQNPQTRSPSPAEAGLHLVGDASTADGPAHCVVGRPEVARRHGEDAVAREDVVADQSTTGPVAFLAQAGEPIVDLAADAGCGIGRSERAGAADPRHPRRERPRAELLR